MRYLRRPHTRPHADGPAHARGRSVALRAARQSRVPNAARRAGLRADPAAVVARAWVPHGQPKQGPHGAPGAPPPHAGAPPPRQLRLAGRSRPSRAAVRRRRATGADHGRDPARVRGRHGRRRATTGASTQPQDRPPLACRAPLAHTSASAAGLNERRVRSAVHRVRHLIREQALERPHHPRVEPVRRLPQLRQRAARAGRARVAAALAERRGDGDHL